MDGVIISAMEYSFIGAAWAHGRRGHYAGLEKATDTRTPIIISPLRRRTHDEARSA